MGNSKSLSKRQVNKLRKDVNMTPDEIKSWYKEYKKSCKGGKLLTVTEFKKVYSQMYEGDANQFAESVFRTFDRDGNGEVDFREFLIGLHVTSSNNMEDKLRWAFEMYDIDKSETITLDEMVHIITSVFKMTGYAVQMPEEMESPEKIAQNIFSKMDANGDGEITWDEFRDGALNDPLVVRLLQVGPDS